MALLVSGTQHAFLNAMVAKLRLVPPPGETEQPLDESSQSRSLPAWVKVVSAVIVFICAVATYVYFEGSQRRAIRRLPPSERQALYNRTLANLRSLCSPAEDSMRAFCLDQARLAMEFAECDSGCRDLADHQLARVQLPR